MSDEALAVQVRTVDAYGRLAPDQKSRIVKALQAGGEIVGFLGDGINDAPALKVADIGLSVDGATGVAQAAADMILLASDLEVVADGVEEGRRTFANILKYVRMGASSNFGNMLSMAVASIALPFLPMLPTQILLNNLLYDLSEIGIPFDGVRPEAMARPQVWDMKGLIRFAAVMGPLSSLFDFATFGVLLYVFHASPAEFRTTWFLEMHGHADPGHLHHPHQRPPLARPPASGAGRLVAAGALRRHGAALHAGRGLVRLPGAASHDVSPHRRHCRSLSRVRRTLEALRHRRPASDGACGNAFGGAHRRTEDRHDASQDQVLDVRRPANHFPTRSGRQQS